MKILFLPSWYPNPSRPVNGVFIREHARAVSRYHDVTVLAVSYLRPKDYQGLFRPGTLTVEDGIKVIRIGLPDAPLWRHVALILATIPVMRWVRRLNPDIIHAHVIFPMGAMAAFLGRLFGIPVVLTEHSCPFELQLKGWLRKPLARWAFARVDLVLAVSRDLVRQMRVLGLNSRFGIIPNAVDVDLFRPLPQERPRRAGRKWRMLLVALLTKIKGVDLLLKAWATSKRRENLRLTIIGDGPERNNLELLAQELGLAAQVTFAGLLDKPRMVPWFRWADFLVLPSLRENQPCVILEAMASGKPVLATRCGGVAEVVKPGLGVLVRPGDVEDLRAGLEILVNWLEKDGFNPRQIRDYALHHFSYETVGKKHDRFYRSLGRNRK